ncbi:MAG: hypothetical protein AABW50_03930, partial [Nanoarchaeota archaeon]
LNANFTNLTGALDRAAVNTLNFTVGAMNENITQVVFTLTGSQEFDPDSFVVGTNGTSASSTNFSSVNATGGGSVTTNLTWANTSALGIIPNGTTRNFWFNMQTRSMASSMLTVTVTATGVSATTNISSGFSFPFTFRFSGYVKNETGGYQNATNISIYDFVAGQNGPPTEILLNTTLSDTNGLFTFTGLSSAGNKMYTLKMIYYNGSAVATKIGTTLPPFPAMMFYPQTFAGAYEFMRPPSLNGTIFYLGPAATINITATNGTASQLFGYMLMEQGTGFPIGSNAFGNVSSVQLVVPTNRQYSVMAIRMNSQFVQYNNTICNGNYMNNTACQTPPKSNSSINPATEGQRIDIVMNLAINRVYMNGCINVTGNSTPITNITSILPRMLPWTGFVPPMKPDTQDINLTNTGQLNYSDSRCPGAIAWYNISLLNSNYLVEFYGRNSTADSAAEWKGAFQNVSFEGQVAGTNNNINVTLTGLAGSFVAASGFGDVNKSEITINIQNSSGGKITDDTPHVDIHVRHPVFGEMTYIIEDFSNGTFTLSLPASATAKAKIFSNNAPPKEKVLNLSLSIINITLTTMSSGNSGFKRVNSSGGIEDMNITNSSFDMGMNFVRNTADCNVINYSNSSCSLSSFDADNFNPFSALVAGKVNMEMKLKSSNVSITFYNFDMFSAKQPPMESVMDNQASSGSSTSNQIWQFGSFVPPDVYDYAVVGIPYSDSVINDSANMNMSVPILYDENWNVAWNYSAGHRLVNLTTSIDDYLDSSNNRSFNSSGYRDLFNGGINCNKTDSNISGSVASVYCYVNTSSNMIYMRVPHFSGVSPNVVGSTPVSDSSSPSSSSSSSGGGVTVG